MSHFPLACPSIKKEKKRKEKEIGRFRGGTARAFSQQTLDKIDRENNTPSWNAFEAELQLVYSDKTKEADAEWHVNRGSRIRSLTKVTTS